MATKRDYTTLSLGRLSAFPCFCVVNELLGSKNGIAGGYMASLEDQTHKAADRVADILKGMPLSAFPKMEQTRKSYIFNYEELDRLNIDLGLLPTDAIFVNMPFVVRYKIILSVLAALVSALLITLFVYQHKQYKLEESYKLEAQKKLREEKASYPSPLKAWEDLRFPGIRTTCSSLTVSSITHWVSP